MKKKMIFGEHDLVGSFTSLFSFLKSFDIINKIKKYDYTGTFDKAFKQTIFVLYTIGFFILTIIGRLCKLCYLGFVFLSNMLEKHQEKKARQRIETKLKETKEICKTGTDIYDEKWVRKAESILKDKYPEVLEGIKEQETIAHRSPNMYKWVDDPADKDMRKKKKDKKKIPVISYKIGKAPAEQMTKNELYFTFLEQLSH